MESTVSFMISMLAFMMNNAIITPRYPSRLMWKNIEMKAAIRVENESTESITESCPDAIRLSEFTFSPILLT